jgi:hypothetical protein
MRIFVVIIRKCSLTLSILCKTIEILLIKTLANHSACKAGGGRYKFGQEYVHSFSTTLMELNEIDVPR